MADPVDIATGAAAGVGGTGILGIIVTALWRRGEKKRDKAEEQVEANEQAKLSEALDLLKTMQHELAEMRIESRLSAERFITVQSAVGEMRERVNGISANHGPKLEALANSVSKLEVQVGALERKGKR